jgi:apolipoprotein N-acyltransferase
VECDFSGEAITPLEKGHHYNSLLALPPGEEVFRTYRKQHLVPFGETIPDIGLLKWVWQKAAGVEYGGSFSAGEGDEPLRVPLARAKGGALAVIPTICFEDTVPRKMRKYVKRGGQVIVNVTNDGWFKESEAAAQHFANAKFRSIELRRPTVRCANTGVSAVIGADGRVFDPDTGERYLLTDGKGNHLTRGWLYATAHVPMEGPVTLYARFGDWFSALGFLVGMGWWVAGRRKSVGGSR